MKPPILSQSGKKAQGNNYSDHKDLVVKSWSVWFLRLKNWKAHACFARIKKSFNMLAHSSKNTKKGDQWKPQSVMNYFYMRAAGKTETTVTVNLPPTIMSSYVFKTNWRDVQIQARMLYYGRYMGRTATFFLRLQSNIFLQCWTCFLKIRNSLQGGKTCYCLHMVATNNSIGRHCIHVIVIHALSDERWSVWQTILVILCFHLRPVSEKCWCCSGDIQQKHEQHT